MTLVIWICGIAAASFIGGVLVGAYGHKWMASKAASVGITPPAKIP